MRGAEESLGPCRIKVLRVSNMTRAKETADIIARYLPGVECAAPDPILNEGRCVVCSLFSSVAFGYIVRLSAVPDLHLTHMIWLALL